MKPLYMYGSILYVWLPLWLASGTVMLNVFKIVKDFITKTLKQKQRNIFSRSYTLIKRDN